MLLGDFYRPWQTLCKVGSPSYLLPCIPAASDCDDDDVDYIMTRNGCLCVMKQRHIVLMGT